MNFTLMPSLERFALIKTAISLWKPDDTYGLTVKYLSINPFVWRVAENRVTEKVKELPLPESLKKKVFGFIRPIGSEICRFLNWHIISLCDEFVDSEVRKSMMTGQFHNYFGYVRFRRVIRKVFEKLCWTAQGTVDRKKTAEGLIRDEDLSITTRYRLACINCLKNDILMLWNKMPEDCKKKFYNEEDPRRVHQDDLVILWTYDIKGEVTRMQHISEVKWLGCTPYQYAFDYALNNGNKPATEYFLQQLTSEERKKCLERKSLFDNKDIVCYLLSQINEVEQVEVCRGHYGQVLSCLLDWPLQGLFMEMAKHLHLGDHLTTCDYFHLLRNITDKVKRGFKDYNYQKLFTEFWQLVPVTAMDVALFIRNGALLRYLLHIKDYENTKLILKDAINLNREKFLFSFKGKRYCKILIEAHKMDLLEFVVQESISSKDLMIKFREELKGYLLPILSEKDTWNNVYQLLDDLTQKLDKRKCVEEGNNGPVKKLCSFMSE